MMAIRVEVQGRPPRKSAAQSLWNDDPESERVFALRHAIKAVMGDGDGAYPTDQPVKVTIEVHGPNIINRQDSHTYIGDLDNFATGVCESIQKADVNVKETSRVFNADEAIKPSVPLVVHDDAQVVEIAAKKVKDAEEKYVVTIEKLD